MKMLQTVTGTLLGVNVAQHPLFKPNVYNFNTTKPTLKGFLNAAAKTVIKGYSGDLVALIPVALFEVLNESISALREYDTSYKPQQALNGVEAIQYRYQGGKIFLVPHLMMMQGDIAFLPLEENVDVEDRAIVRRGSVDLSFELPDEDGKIFLQVADTAAKEIRSYSDQGLSYRKPGWCAHGKNASY